MESNSIFVGFDCFPIASLSFEHVALVVVRIHTLIVQVNRLLCILAGRDPVTCVDVYFGQVGVGFGIFWIQFDGTFTGIESFGGLALRVKGLTQHGQSLRAGWLQQDCLLGLSERLCCALAQGQELRQSNTRRRVVRVDGHCQLICTDCFAKLSLTVIGFGFQDVRLRSASGCRGRLKWFAPLRIVRPDVIDEEACPSDEYEQEQYPARGASFRLASNIHKGTCLLLIDSSAIIAWSYFRDNDSPLRGSDQVIGESRATHV